LVGILEIGVWKAVQGQKLAWRFAPVGLGLTNQIAVL